VAQTQEDQVEAPGQSASNLLDSRLVEIGFDTGSRTRPFATPAAGSRDSPPVSTTASMKSAGHHRGDLGARQRQSAGLPLGAV